ncbi:MAG: SufS family cysteine desulfurase [Deltaproteobacteria bacterium]|nr:SufS family cysteine desulfurase [Deltaproteobacteria bacterium]
MTTASDLPPHELRGPLGQVGDAGGGVVPALTPAPVPNAVAGGSPGLAAAATKPPPSVPTLPSDDPSSVALLISRMANEMFGGASVVPVPSPQQVLSGAGVAPPASPGIAPTLAPGPLPASGLPTETAATAIPTAIPSAPVGGDFNPFLQPIALPDDLGAPSGMPDFGATYLPLVEVTGIDAPPGWIPSAQPAPAVIEPVHELQPEHPLARDLGGNAFDPYRARADFPILEERVHGKRLVWLDNAATTQKPRAVIERLSQFYTRENSNIHRAAHTLAARATDAYEQGRESTRKFLNAPSTQEILFVRGATEGINLVAQSWGRRHVREGDEIVITHLEHHANIVPWQQLCAEKGARLRVAPVDDRGDVILEEYEKLFNPRTRLASIPQVSNALGTITPTREMVEIAHRYGAKVLVDGAQAVSHMRVDVQALDCDFYVFSGHKVFAPTGIGAVFGKRELLEAMPPWQGGGNMIQDVTFERTTYMPPPFRFEAGTGSIGDAAGLGAALDYVMKIGMDVIDRYEHDLLVYATERLVQVPGLTMIGTSPNKAGVLSFVLDGQRTEDVGAALDKEGIAVRSGHHCAQPILRRFGLEATVRASLAFYNVCEDIDALIDALMKLQSGRRGVQAPGLR